MEPAQEIRIEFTGKIHSQKINVEKQKRKTQTEPTQAILIDFTGKLHKHKQKLNGETNY